MIDPAGMIDEVEKLSPAEMDSFLAVKGQYLVTAGMGDLLPTCAPFYKIPWLEAMLGCPIMMTEGHIWNEHYRGDSEEVIRRGANLEGNPWFELYKEFLRQLQARLSGRFAVTGNTLLRGTCDLVAAVMGVEQACMGWIDDPKFMARMLRVCTDANLAVIEAGNKLLQPFHGGYISGFHLWAPAPVLRTQADHATLMSAEMYEKQVLPFDREVLQAAPVAMMHIHNPTLHIAPILAKIPELDALEVAVDPYPRPERKPYEMRMLKLVQEHKPLILDVNFPSWEESQSVLEELSPRGLCFNARFDPQVWATLPPNLPGSEVWVLDE
jgi:hypothetical protein